MSGLLADLYSAGDRMKRKLGGLLSNPLETIALGSTRMAEDTNALTRLVSEAGYMPNTVNRSDQSVLVSEKQKALARALLADKGAEMGMAAATVWHGSPHKFDKFDSSKIGTGEGAQAYGHGLYLAESPDVAKQYAAEVSAAKRKIADRSGLFVNGQRLDMSDPSALLYAEIADKGAQQAIAERMSAIEKLIQQKGADYPLVKIKQKGLEQFKALAAKGGDVKRITDVDVFQPSPQVYKVDLPDNAIARMLDWDKPLADQSAYVAGQLERAGMYDPLSRMSHGTLWHDISAHISNKRGSITKNLKRDQAAAAEAMREIGIPGIRYLDRGSRGAGQGTSNYVIFPQNEGLLTILERNGVPIK